jgi:hypothetical protein
MKFFYSRRALAQTVWLFVFALGFILIPRPSQPQVYVLLLMIYTPVAYLVLAEFHSKKTK